METSTLTSKGQLLIPKRIRNKYRIKAGVKVVFVETDEGLLIKAMDQEYFEQFAGKFKDSLPSSEELKRIKQDEKELEEKKMRKIFTTKKTGK
jgi:AbrB family looped-hinge helix DNA binding protein